MIFYYKGLQKEWTMSAIFPFKVISLSTSDVIIPKTTSPDDHKIQSFKGIYIIIKCILYIKALGDNNNQLFATKQTKLVDISFLRFCDLRTGAG